MSYSHFCHRRFLRDYRSQISGSGLASHLRLLDHRLHARLERWVYGNVKRIVVPSEGLRRELAAEYPRSADKITVIANPVEIETIAGPRTRCRRFPAHMASTPKTWCWCSSLSGTTTQGHAATSGRAGQMCHPRLKLMVVGGMGNLVEKYRGICREKKLEQRVTFVGMQKDVRPFFWSRDAFVLPSFYEVFPLVALEAAASALPLIVTPVNGIEEFVVDRHNGIKPSNPKSRNILSIRRKRI